ncbi:MAG: hypothetical protein EOP49_39700 [Sphingobacteriales bacterium]|nr:MAG: hypothetical protein EOP49_39700 [Sphingobacteriales bacterium]
MAAAISETANAFSGNSREKSPFAFAVGKNSFDISKNSREKFSLATAAGKNSREKFPLAMAVWKNSCDFLENSRENFASALAFWKNSREKLASALADWNNSCEFFKNSREKRLLLLVVKKNSRGFFQIGSCYRSIHNVSVRLLSAGKSGLLTGASGAAAAIQRINAIAGNTTAAGLQAPCDREGACSRSINRIAKVSLSPAERRRALGSPIRIRAPARLNRYFLKTKADTG